MLVGEVTQHGEPVLRVVARAMQQEDGGRRCLRLVVRGHVEVTVACTVEAEHLQTGFGPAAEVQRACLQAAFGMVLLRTID